MTPPKQILTSFSVICLSLSMFLVLPPSQVEAGNWTWKRYKLKFWIPNAMRPTRNNRREFIAKGHGIVLKIKPWKSRNSTSVSAARYGLRTYSILTEKRVLRRKRIRNVGAYSYLLLGRAYYRGAPAYFAVIGLSSKRSRDNFYVRMWWRKNNHDWIKRRIVRIARSLHAYGWNHQRQDDGMIGNTDMGTDDPPPRRSTGFWTWKRYRLKFWLPPAMRPTRNNHYQFIAKGHGIVLKILPWRSRSSTSVSAARYGLRSYRIIRDKEVLRRKRIRTHGAYSYLMLGRGYYRGSQVYFAVIGLSSKRSANNFYVRMWWRKSNHNWIKRRIVRIAQRLRTY